MNTKVENPGDLEIFLNELQTDLEVQRLVTQALFLNIIRLQQTPELLTRIKEEVLAVASRSITDEKMRLFYLIRVERFFQQIEQAPESIQSKSSAPGAKH